MTFIFMKGVPPSKKVDTYQSPARGELTHATHIYGVGAGTRTALRAVRVELAAGAGWARDEKIFVRVTEC